MRNTKITIVILLLLVGCKIDEPDMYNQDSFSKVYGFDGVSFSNDIIETRNGDFLIVGNFHKTTSSGDVGGPFIMRTDANGNQLQFRNFYFRRGIVTKFSEWLAQFDGVAYHDTTMYVWDLFISRPNFLSVTELDNGNFLLTGQLNGFLDNSGFGYLFIVVMNPDFKPLRFDFLNNTDFELNNGTEVWHWVRDPKPILMGNGDVIILWGDEINVNGEFLGYSIYRLNRDGDIIDFISAIPLKDKSGPDSWIMDGQDHVIVCGTTNDPGPFINEDAERDNDIWIQNINLDTKSVEKEAIITKGYYSYSWRGGILATDDGFVLGDYHAHAIGENNQGYQDDGYRNIYGGLWYVNANLDSIGHADLTGLEVEQQIGRIVRTNDNGIVAAYSRKNLEGNDVLIVKADSDGNPIWRKVLNSIEDVSKIIVSRDGGIMILTDTDFDSMGNRVNLIKLTADGNF